MNKKIRIIGFTFLLSVLGILFLLSLHRTVTIRIDGQTNKVSFWGYRVKDALSADGLKLRKGDIVTPSINSKIENYKTIEINQASWHSVFYGGAITTIWTSEIEPEAIILTTQIELKAGDELLYGSSVIDSNTKNSALSQTISLEIQPQTQISFSENGIDKTFSSTADTLIEALWDEGIRVYRADYLAPPSDTKLVGKNIKVTLIRSKEVTIESVNKSFQTRMLGSTVSDALAQIRYPLQGLDYSIPPETDRIPEDGQIKIVDIQEKVITEHESIPFKIQYTPLSTVNLDNFQIVQNGEYGITAKRVNILYENGSEISRHIEQEWIAKDPIPRLIGYGTKIGINSIETPSGTFQYYRVVEAYATSYSPCRIGIPGKCSSTTASGSELRKGVIGVIRSWYNYMKGNTVYIPGYGIGKIEDIGAGFSDRNWVDLGYSDDDWINWSGYVTVYFLTPVPANILYILN